MERSILFTIFLVFNCLFGISALSVLVITVYLIIKLKFNQYIIIVGVVGILMLLITIMGFFCKKRDKLLLTYITLISIIFLIELSLSMIFKFSKDLKDFIKTHIKEIIDITDDMRDKIINIAFIILCSASGCCILSCLSSLIYYIKLISKKKKYEKVDNTEEMFKGLDYTNLNPDVSTMSN